MSDSEARWYSVSRTGQAMLCVDEADAVRSSATSSIAFAFDAPYRAVQMVDIAAVAALRKDAGHLCPVVVVNDSRGRAGRHDATARLCEGG